MNRSKLLVVLIFVLTAVIGSGYLISLKYHLTAPTEVQDFIHSFDKKKYPYAGVKISYTKDWTNYKSTDFHFSCDIPKYSLIQTIVSPDKQTLKLDFINADKNHLYIDATTKFNRGDDQIYENRTPNEGVRTKYGIWTKFVLDVPEDAAGLHNYRMQLANGGYLYGLTFEKEYYSNVLGAIVSCNFQ